MCGWAFRAAGQSDVGAVRSNNEDSGYVSDRILLVADGVGGGPSGEIASQTVVEELVATFSDFDCVVDQEGLRAKLLQANQQLASEIDAHPDLAGMATTLTALVINHDAVTLIHVGDSRAYVLRDGVLTQLSRDDSLVQELVDHGDIDPAMADQHPMRNMVIKSLSGQPGDARQATLRDWRICPGDRFLVASDGLTDYVPHDELQKIMTSDVNLEVMVQDLVHAALVAESQDNITAIVADVCEPYTSQHAFIGAAAQHS